MELNKELGKEVDLKIEMKNGKLALGVSYDGSGADASVQVAVDPGYFIDKLAALIPGQVDDAIFAVLKAALLAQK